MTTTATGLGFAGGGDGVLRAFDLRTGRCSGVPDRAPDRRRPDDLLRGREAVRRDHRRRDADLVERRHGLEAPGVRARREPARVAAAGARPAARAATRPRRRAAAGARAHGPGGDGPRAPDRDRGRSRSADALASVELESRDRAPAACSLGGKPVAGARVAVDRYVLPRATDAEGRFTAPVDTTLVRRHPVRVVGVAQRPRRRAAADRRRSGRRCAARGAASASATASPTCARGRAERHASS